MKKKFNITGTCIPARHYMANIPSKLDNVLLMIEEGSYFTIDRPRQYGKTTLLYLLEERLKNNQDYVVLNISFEDIDAAVYRKHSLFISTLLDILKEQLEFLGENAIADMLQEQGNITTFNRLGTLFTRLIKQTGRKVVLMIDEVDKAGNNQLFLDFLGLLRKKYLRRNEGRDVSFQSVILAGVHDVKTLKTKIRPEEKRMFNSPWNIAVDFEIDLSLKPAEISSMLEDYATAENVKIDIPCFAQELYYYTSGYPFLVSLLCKIIDEEILPGKAIKEWQIGDITTACHLALKRNYTNFESLVKNLENDSELYDFVSKIILHGQFFSYNPDNPVIKFGFIHGILRREADKIAIHNRVYEQRIFNYMSSKLETSRKVDFDHVSSSYLDNNGALDVEIKYK